MNASSVCTVDEVLFTEGVSTPHHTSPQVTGVTPEPVMVEVRESDEFYMVRIPKNIASASMMPCSFDKEGLPKEALVKLKGAVLVIHTSGRNKAGVAVTRQLRSRPFYANLFLKIG